MTEEKNKKVTDGNISEKDAASVNLMTQAFVGIPGIPLDGFPPSGGNCPRRDDPGFIRPQFFPPERK